MRFIVDTNILIYAVNFDCAEHAKARRFLDDHVAARTPWCLTWGIVYEFLRVSTHARVFHKPLSARQACGFISAFLALDQVSVLSATNRNWEVAAKTIGELSHPAGNLFHDIETAVLAREHGVAEIVTADTDFLQFGFLKVNNPLRG
jgi:hypothetical protein